jgi:ribosomal protein L19E
MIKQNKEINKKLFEDIYDLIKGGDFEKEAKSNIRHFIKNKEIAWDGDNDIISLGKRFKIKLL